MGTPCVGTPGVGTPLAESSLPMPLKDGLCESKLNSTSPGLLSEWLKTIALGSLRVYGPLVMPVVALLRLSLMLLSHGSLEYEFDSRTCWLPRSTLFGDSRILLSLLIFYVKGYYIVF